MLGNLHCYHYHPTLTWHVQFRGQNLALFFGRHIRETVFLQKVAAYFAKGRTRIPWVRRTTKFTFILFLSQTRSRPRQRTLLLFVTISNFIHRRIFSVLLFCVHHLNLPFRSLRTVRSCLNANLALTISLTVEYSHDFTFLFKLVTNLWGAVLDIIGMCQIKC